jgi:hypothetical protein
MLDRRKRTPNKLWEMLVEFAEGDGRLEVSRRPGGDEFEKARHHRRLQKRRELLAKALQRFFGIRSDPFVPADGGKGWTSLFKIGRKH